MVPVATRGMQRRTATATAPCLALPWPAARSDIEHMRVSLLSTLFVSLVGSAHPALAEVATTTLTTTLTTTPTTTVASQPQAPEVGSGSFRIPVCPADTANACPGIAIVQCPLLYGDDLIYDLCSTQCCSVHPSCGCGPTPGPTIQAPEVGITVVEDERGACIDDIFFVR